MAMTFEKMMKNIENQLDNLAEGIAEERGIPDVAHLVMQDRIKSDVIFMMYEQFKSIGEEYPEHALENCIEYLDMQIRWDVKRTSMYDDVNDYDRVNLDALNTVKFCTQFDPDDN